MAPLNWLATRLWSRAKPIESRRREAPITAIERGEKTASRGRAGRSDDSIARTSGFGEENLELLLGQADPHGQPLLAEIAVDLGFGAGRAGEEDLVDLSDLHVAAPHVGGAQEVEDEAEGRPAPAAAEEDQLKPVAVRAGLGGEPEGAGVEGEVRDGGE